MIYEIPIEKLPGQILGVNLADAGYIIKLRNVNDLTLTNVEINGASVITGAKCLPNHKIIPYPHLTQGGNFYFYCQDNDYPDYRKFGENHKLLFLTDDEIADLADMKDLPLNGQA